MSVEETLRLDGRTALVTGASRGIGRQAALTMAAMKTCSSRRTVASTRSPFDGK